jgi:hypothetical protein
MARDVQHCGWMASWQQHWPRHYAGTALWTRHVTASFGGPNICDATMGGCKGVVVQKVRDALMVCGNEGM